MVSEKFCACHGGTAAPSIWCKSDPAKNCIGSEKRLLVRDALALHRIANTGTDNETHTISDKWFLVRANRADRLIPTMNSREDAGTARVKAEPRRFWPQVALRRAGRRKQAHLMVGMSP
jgi:hypothetical protein